MLQMQSTIQQAEKATALRKNPRLRRDLSFAGSALRTASRSSGRDRFVPFFTTCAAAEERGSLRIRIFVLFMSFHENS